MSARSRFHVRMTARATDEENRTATPFELLFDLVFVVAVASLVTQFAHATEQGNIVDHITPFLMVFFAIWWGWMNFTWFSSGYDTQDAVYRVLGIVQMGGVLVVAAGVPAAFEHFDYRLITVGYLIMRLALVALWVRAAIEHPASRSVSMRYAVGITVVQVLWLLRLLLPAELLVAGFLVLAVAELAVPLWATRRGDTPWNPGHIAERYGLFVIILLGEGVLAASNGVQAALAAAGGSVPLVIVAVAGLVILVGLWWVYFLQPAEDGLIRRPGLAYFWGYGHYLLFASIAAVGAGLEVSVQVLEHHTEVSQTAAGLAVALPTALVLILIWALHRPLVEGSEVSPATVIPAAILMVIAALLAPVIQVVGVVVVAALLTAAVVVITIGTKRSAP